MLPHALYLTAVLSYRLRPVEEQLYISHELCVRAKRIRDYDFDCQVEFPIVDFVGFVDRMEDTRKMGQGHERVVATADF